MVTPLIVTSMNPSLSLSHTLYTIPYNSTTRAHAIDSQIRVEFSLPAAMQTKMSRRAFNEFSTQSADLSFTNRQAPVVTGPARESWRE